MTLGRIIAICIAVALAVLDVMEYQSGRLVTEGGDLSSTGKLLAVATLLAICVATGAIRIRMTANPEAIKKMGVQPNGAKFTLSMKKRGEDNPRSFTAGLGSQDGKDLRVDPENSKE